MNNLPINDAFVVQCPSCHHWICGKTDTETISCFKCKKRIKWRNYSPHGVPAVEIAVKVCERLNLQAKPIDETGIATSVRDLIGKK